MQKLWLKNFEFHIIPSTWNTAQDLVQMGAVRQLQEMEKHFWMAKVTGDDFLYEVEAIITPHKIKAYTCECWAEGRRLMCPHIAAALLKIRQFLDQKAAARQAQVENRQPESLARISVQNILEMASMDEIAGFIQAYSRRDRDFALALKTWFTNKFTGMDNPYRFLLDAALPRHPGSRALRDPEIRRLRKTLDDLQLQLATAVAGANAQTLFLLVVAILEKITPLALHLDEPRRSTLLAYCQTALQQLLQMPDAHLSPELREKRWHFVFEFLTQPQHPLELESTLIGFLSRTAAEEAPFSAIRTLFDHTPYPAPPAVLSLFLTALAQREMPEAVVRVLRDYSERPAQIKEAIAALSQQQCWMAVMLAGEYFLDQNLFNTGQRREIEDLIMDAADKTADKTRQMTYLRLRYRQYGQTDTFARLKSLAGPEWPVEQRRLLIELQLAGDAAKLAPFLAAENQLDDLTHLLMERRDLALLRQYEDLLCRERKPFVFDFYFNILSDYLADHFGKPASGHVRATLSGLLHKGQSELAREIIGALIARFPDRHTLPEELAEIFPKTNKQQAFHPIAANHES
ncbi:MAG: hypothetical protein IPM81_00720 [Saprospirales bacterium]|nr:hypothetical protein [Saprospirales bacterium]